MIGRVKNYATESESLISIKCIFVFLVARSFQDNEVKMLISCLYKCYCHSKTQRMEIDLVNNLIRSILLIPDLIICSYQNTSIDC